MERDLLGETIGNFRLTALLGQGGMGEVFVAHQTSIDTKVAIKLLRPEVSTHHDHVQRFFNEARAVNRIKHPGIVRIFDVGVHGPSGRAYLVMELLEGETVRSRITRERVQLVELAELGRQATRILDATHAAGITHRDLKPDNIFLVPDEELAPHPRVKIVDFGIAKLTGTIGAGQPRTVGMMGTPDYMAPEQWGDSSKVDGRADIYALGCVLFEVVCGRPPFLAETYAEACAKHLAHPPPVASSLAPSPPELDDLLARMLAKDPAARPGLREVGRALSALAGRTADESAPLLARASDSRPVSIPSPEATSERSGSAEAAPVAPASTAPPTPPIPSPVSPTLPLTMPPTVPSAIAPELAPTVPLTEPPQAVQPTVPPAVPPALAPTVPPAELLESSDSEPAPRRWPFVVLGAGAIIAAAIGVVKLAGSGTTHELAPLPELVVIHDAAPSPDAAPRNLEQLIAALATGAPAVLDAATSVELRAAVRDRTGAELALERVVVVDAAAPSLPRVVAELAPRTLLILRAGRYTLDGTAILTASDVMIAGVPGTRVYAPSGSTVLRVKAPGPVVLHGLYLNHHASSNDWKVVMSSHICGDTYGGQTFFAPVVTQSNVLEVEQTRAWVHACELEGSGFMGLVAREAEVVVRDSKIHHCISDAIRLEKARVTVRDLIVYAVGNREFLATSGDNVYNNREICNGRPQEVCYRQQCATLTSCTPSDIANYETVTMDLYFRDGGWSLQPKRFASSFHVDASSTLTVERLTLRVPEPLRDGHAFAVEGTVAIADSVIDHRTVFKLGKAARATMRNSCVTAKELGAKVDSAGIHLAAPLAFRKPAPELAFDGVQTIEGPCRDFGARLSDATIRIRELPGKKR